PNRRAAAPRDSIRPVTLAVQPSPPNAVSSGGKKSVISAPAAPPPEPIIVHQIKMTVGPEFLACLSEVRAALSHVHPQGRLEDVLLSCMKTALAQHRKRRQAEVTRPRPAAARPQKSGSRHVAAAVKREVYARDQGCCTFFADDGKRCGERKRLEFHHRVAFAHGGPSTAANISLRCRRHNDLEA